MKSITVLTTALILIALANSGQADDIAISTRQISNLGIATAAPEIAREVAMIEATARVVIPPMNESIISTPHAGLLADLNVSVGDDVTRGQVLARIQSSDFLALQREFLDALNASLLTQNEFQRDSQLFDEGIISQRRLQETTTRFRIAETGLNEHRQLLQIAGISDGDIKALETRQKLVQTLEIRAPFDGVILDRMASAGERLSEMSPVYRLADLSSLWLEIDVAQEHVGSVEPGMRVAVSGSQARLPGVVTTIGRSIDPATQSTMIRAELDDSDHGLKPGQFVSVKLVANTADTANNTVWAVPIAAVIRSGNRHLVFVQTQSGFDVRDVLIVGSGAEHIYITADISTESSIAIDGVSTLKSLWAAQMESDS